LARIGLRNRATRGLRDPVVERGVVVLELLCEPAQPGRRTPQLRRTRRLDLRDAVLQRLVEEGAWFAAPRVRLPRGSTGACYHGELDDPGKHGILLRVWMSGRQAQQSGDALRVKPGMNTAPAALMRGWTPRALFVRASRQAAHAGTRWSNSPARHQLPEATNESPSARPLPCRLRHACADCVRTPQRDLTTGHIAACR